MNESEARARCAELAETSPDRETHSWVAKEQPDGTWSVMKLAIPPAKTQQTSKTTSTKDQTTHEDPRSAIEKNLPPHSTWI